MAPTTQHLPPTTYYLPSTILSNVPSTIPSTILPTLPSNRTSTYRLPTSNQPNPARRNSKKEHVYVLLMEGERDVVSEWEVGSGKWVACC